MSEADDLAGGQSLSGDTLYNLAGVVALSAAGAARDGTRPLPERDKHAERWSRQALALLQRAARTDYFRDPANRAQLDRNADLAFLRDRDDFRAFVKTLMPLN